RGDDDHQTVMGYCGCAFESLRIDRSRLLQTIDPHVTRNTRQAIRARPHAECARLGINMVPRAGFLLRLPSGTIRTNIKAWRQPRLRGKSALGSLRVLRRGYQRLWPIEPVPVQRRGRPHVVSAKVQIALVANTR